MRILVRSALIALVAAGIAEAGAASLAQAPSSGSASGDALFDGKTLTNWTPTKFIGEGPVKVENGEIVLESGNDLTGITWSGATLPTTNYELTLQAMRVAGGDFFAGVTFPVGDSFCSLILGGWGGTVVGLSSVNGMDASENETSQSIPFESKRWYSVRIHVTAAKIGAWLDDRPIISQDLKGNKVDTRIEVDASKPLGIASWRTKAALKEIRLKKI